MASAGGRRGVEWALISYASSLFVFAKVYITFGRFVWWLVVLVRLWRL